MHLRCVCFVPAGGSGFREEGQKVHTDSFSPIWQSICDELMIRASSRNLDLSLVVLERQDVQLMEEGPGGPGVCDRRGAEPRHHEGRGAGRRAGLPLPHFPETHDPVPCHGRLLAGKVLEAPI